MNIVLNLLRCGNISWDVDGKISFNGSANCSSYDAQRYGEYLRRLMMSRDIFGISHRALSNSWLPGMALSWRRHPMPFDAFYVSMLSIGVVHVVSWKGCMSEHWHGSALWDGRGERIPWFTFSGKVEMEIKADIESNSIFDMQFKISISTTLVLLLLGLVVFFVLTAHNLSVYMSARISVSPFH